MLRVNGRLLALACCLLPGSLAVDAKPGCSDSFGLLQLDMNADYKGVRLKPKYHGSHAVREEPLMLNELEPAAQSLNGSMIVNTLWARHLDPFSALMKFLSVLFNAVRKETFMKGVNELSKATAKVIVEFKERSTQLASDFDLALKGELSEAELVSLTAEYFTKEAHLMNSYYEKRSGINKRTIRSMPTEISDAIASILSIMTSQENIDATQTLHLDGTVDTQSFCQEVGLVQQNISDLNRGMVETKRQINGTQKMTPMIKNYLSTMKPELVPRIIWVLNMFLETEWMGADTLASVSSNVTLHASPVLEERLRCSTLSGNSPRSGVGLLTLLLLAAQALLVRERPCRG